MSDQAELGADAEIVERGAAEVREPSAKYLVKFGYKQTEVGFIPDSWDVKPLRDISAISSGGTPSRVRADYWTGDVPWITTSQIDFSSIKDAEQFISKKGLQNSAAKLLPPGTLLLALYGQGKTRGKVGVLGIEAATNQACAAIEITRDVSSNFLLHYLASQYEAIRGMSNGGSQDNLNSGIVKSILVPVPPAKEQDAIATALSDVDALIAGLERLIAKKRDIKQAAMQQLLTGQTRLPGFSGEWVTKLLPELADIRSGGTPSTADSAAWDGDIAWCTPTDITALAGRKYLTQTERRITEQGLKQSSAEVIPAGSIVMTSRATIGECAINAVSMTTNQGFKNFVPFESVDAEFLYYLLTTQKAGFISLCGGSTFLEIGKTQLRGYAISLPADKAEQTAIATLLSDMDTELSALEARLAKTRAIKQGMMQELLTGRTRLLEPTKAQR